MGSLLYKLREEKTFLILNIFLISAYQNSLAKIQRYLQIERKYLCHVMDWMLIASHIKSCYKWIFKKDY